jgi:hypothetical protein
MKTSSLVGIILVLSGTLALEIWESGYFMRLAPFGAYTPFVTLGLLLAIPIVAATATLKAIRAKRPAIHRAGMVAVIVAIALLPLFTPSGVSGFERRIRQTSDAEWLRPAVDVQRMLCDSTTKRQLPCSSDRHRNRRIAMKLAQTHPVLRLGEFPPRLYAGENSVDVSWGNGLNGTLAVHITTNPAAEVRTPSNGREKRISDVVRISWD